MRRRPHVAREESGMEEYILETRALTKSFRGFVAVDRVSLRVRRGTIHGLIGPNGAGKSTMFNLMTKFLQPDSGVIRYDGTDITDTRPEEIALRGVARSFQISAVFPHLTVRENVRIALQQRRKDWFRFWRSETCLQELNGDAEAFANLVGLGDRLDDSAAALPYGRRRALEIATTLALEPRMLLLDEPMSGLGREDVGRISELIRRVANDRTVLMVEHNLSVIASLCDTITVMSRGRILAEGTYAEVAQNPEVRAAYLGGEHG